MRRRLVVLMGLDGSGKSTQAQLLANWLREQGVPTEVVWMRGESYVTRPLLGLAKAVLRAPKGTKRGGAARGATPGRGATPSRGAPVAEAASDAQGAAPVQRPSQEQGATQAYARYTAGKRSLFRNPLVRVLWRNLVLLDFFITFKSAFARLPRRTRVVILDRYFYDSLIDIDSGFGSGGSELRRLLGSPLVRVFPRPDRVVLLEIPPAEAMRRKDDIPSVEYLEERHGLYRAVAESTGALVVDAAKPIDEVAAALVEAIGRSLV